LNNPGISPYPITMFQLLYFSKAIKEYSDEDLKALLYQSIENNSRKNITGMLIYHEQNFIQILEGERKELKALMSKILLDSRHYDVKIIRESEIERRQFQDWMMVYKYLENNVLTKLEETKNQNILSYIRAHPIYVRLRNLSLFGNSLKDQTQKLWKDILTEDRDIHEINL